MIPKMRGSGADPVSGYLRNINSNKKVVKALTHAMSRPIAVRPEHLGHLLRNDAGAVTDFLIGAAPFYGCDAQAMSARQVSDYFEQNPQDERGLAVITRDDTLPYQFAAEVDREAPRPFMLQPQLSGFGLNYRAPKSYCATLVIFGLGLGYHLEPLIRLYRPLRIVLFEPHLESWAASMAALDWERVQQACRQFGTELIAIYHDDPERTPFVILEAIRRGSGALSCFVRYFRHYASPALEQARTSFEKIANYLTAPAGYLADELRQVEETARNLRSHRIAISPPFKSAVPGSCALVIGSGPSLEFSMDLIREYREHAHVVSCGTALHRLLQEGIIPDFHVELETHPTILPKLYADLAGRLGGIQFFASTGVPDAALAHFSDPILFFRHNSTSSTVAAGLASTVPFSFARVGSAGAAVAAFLGFESIVMLGMDNGYLEDAPEHAQGTIYEKEIGQQIVDIVFEGTEHASDEIQKSIRSERSAAKTPVLGISGKTVMMDNSFLLAVGALHDLATSRPDIRLYQVGFGAFIKGAINLVPKDFQARQLAFKKSIEIGDAVRAVTSHPELGDAYRLRLAKLAASTREMGADLRRIHARGFEDVDGFARNDRDAIRRLDTHWERIDKAAYSLLRGTVVTHGKTTIERAMMHQERAERGAFLRIAQKHLLETIQRMIALVADRLGTSK